MSKVLVIEDELELRESIVEILGFESFDVVEAENGEIGIEVAKSELPDLILCDIMMPGKNGFEVLTELSKFDEFSQIPFIFITALSDRTNTREGMNLGADDYLTKPFSKDELIDVVNSKLKKYRRFISAYSKQISEIEETLNDELDQLKSSNQELIEHVDQKEKEVIKEALKAIETNNTLNTIKKEIKEYLGNQKLSNDERKHFVNLNNKVSHSSLVTNNSTIFQLKFNQTYPNFITNLSQKHAKLTEYEMLLASSILSGLNNNQTADLLNVTPESARKSRYRLKKKLGLTKDDDLLQYVTSFNR